MNDRNHRGKYSVRICYAGRQTAIFMVALCNRADHNIFALWFLLSSFSSTNLNGRRLDVYRTSSHGVALV